ncbi:hypothetical protein Rsub_12474 [Raphidocelis subcapitata]|uniref:Uncharacterized protein n=1 Tax=Raphidocelis subcapitata TaxID=307507 RepID=A0A2V0PQZ4_9CHLO|nr:hypothetical protein Rsub_12474 [Raphidocelis subcapitata]|eukprot:GBF99655.1 hypothetical protein Rsub_12474 [Raphidocelis subcapitata]
MADAAERDQDPLLIDEPRRPGKPTGAAGGAAFAGDRRGPQPPGSPAPFSIEVAAEHARADAPPPGAGWAPGLGSGARRRHGRGRAWPSAWVPPPAALARLGRVLVCSYFVFNIVFGELQQWRHLTSDPRALAATRRWASDPDPPPPGFPWGVVCLVLPAALAAAAARVWGALLLLLFLLWRDGAMVGLQLKAIALHGSRPSELLVKPLAICGATALLLAASVSEARSRARAGAWVGPPTAGDDDDGGADAACGSGDATGPAAGAAWTLPRRRRASRRRSALLLAGRCLMTVLLAFSGWMQVQRMRARAAAPGHGGTHHWGLADPRDNPLALAETAMGAALALGVATRPVSGALAATLAAEALLYWRFWGPVPHPAYRAGLREGFFTALALAGGSLLLASLGGGAIAVDAAIAAARKQQ